MFRFPMAPAAILVGLSLATLLPGCGGGSACAAVTWAVSRRIECLPSVASASGTKIESVSSPGSGMRAPSQLAPRSIAIERRDPSAKS